MKIIVNSGFNFVLVLPIYFLIEVYLVCSVLISVVQQNDSVICNIYLCMYTLYIYIYTVKNILLHYSLSQDIEYSSLCHTVKPWCLSILCIKASIC